jgi:hypothetical protein
MSVGSAHSPGVPGRVPQVGPNGHRPASDSHWSRFWGFVRRWWSSVATGPVTALLLGTAAIAQGDSFDLFNKHVSWPIALVVLAAAVAVGGTLETSRRIRRLEQAVVQSEGLQSRASRAELALIDSICDDLKHLVASLGLYSNGRASLFLWRHDHFVLAGRYSPMPRYSQSPGREIYPVSSGIIGKAWDNGEADDPDLPDPGEVNRPPSEEWLTRQAEFGVSDDVARAFVMRSRAYAAIRLDEFERRRLGVLVVETDRPAGATAISTAGGGNAGGSIEALRVLASSPIVYSLSRSLHHLRECDDADVRSALVSYLPDR